MVDQVKLSVTLLWQDDAFTTAAEVDSSSTFWKPSYVILETVETEALRKEKTSYAGCDSTACYKTLVQKFSSTFTNTNMASTW